MDLLNKADVNTDGQLSKESEVTSITGQLRAGSTIQVAHHIMDRPPVRNPLEAHGQAAYSRTHRARNANFLATQQLTKEITLAPPPQSLSETLTPSPCLDHAQPSTQEIAKAPSAPSGATELAHLLQDSSR